MKIYVASSWRNEITPNVVSLLRKEGFEVYDFKNPPEKPGFSWSEIDPDWQNWSFEQYKEALSHSRSVEGFYSDFNAMQAADVCVLVLPCGASAHIEAGYFVGAGKKLIILIPSGPYIGKLKFEAELMYKMADLVTNRATEIIAELNKFSKTTKSIKQ